jgi:hypothetical protein
LAKRLRNCCFVFAGVLGGLLPELVQSQGKFILSNTVDKGNLALGGLVGVITGGIAGVVLYSGLTIAAGTKLTPVVFVMRFGRSYD